MSYPNLVFRAHAVQRMAQRQISVASVRHILATGQVIEDSSTTHHTQASSYLDG